MTTTTRRRLDWPVLLLALWGASLSTAGFCQSLGAAQVKPGIQAAQALLKAQNHAAALAKLRELDPLPGKTPYDTYMLERTRLAAAAMANNDPELVLRSMAAVLDTKLAPPDEELKFTDHLVRSYFNQKNYASTIVWATRYFKAGGNEDDMRRSLLYSYYMTNDCPRVVQEVNSDVQADEKISKMPAEYQLRLLVSCAEKTGNKAAYDSATARYNSYYPKQ